MKKNGLDTLFYSAGGLVLLAVILIAGNFLISVIKVRADLTQGSVYTLSEGTRTILSKLEAPVDRKSTRLNSSHVSESRMPSSA